MADMFTLTICPTGTVDAACSQHETMTDARNALTRFARGYDIHGDDRGTLTTRCGRVNQASYTWVIRTEDGSR